MRTVKKIDWRKHDRKAPGSTYIRLAKPGDVLIFPGDNRLWQVKKVTPPKTEYDHDCVSVKFHGEREDLIFGPMQRARLFFRFANPDKVEDLTVS